MNVEKTLGLGIKINKKVKKTQDLIPEVAIEDGVIISVDNVGKKHYTKIIEIIALNYFIKSPAEQDRLIIKYAKSLKMGPQSFKIKIVTKESNVEEYVELAKQAFLKEENKQCKKLIQNYIAFLVESQQNMEALKKHYYFIYEYEPDAISGVALTEEDAIMQVNAMADQVCREFRSIGNEVILFDSHNCKYEYASLLYSHYNRRTQYKESFEDRVDRINSDIRKINELGDFDEEPNLNLKDIICPKSIDFGQSPDYVIMDGLYRGHYYVEGNSIPTIMVTGSGWLANLCDMGYGFDVDIFFFKGNDMSKLLSVRRNLRFSKYKAEQAEDEQINADEIYENYSGSMFLKNALKSSGENIYEMAVLLTLTTDTKEIFYQAHKFLLREAVRADLSIRLCKRMQEEGLYSTGYNLFLDDKIFAFSHRNLTTSAVAASYPYTSFSLNDENGIALGKNIENNSLVCLNLYAKKYANANMFIAGGSGQGKTYTVLTVSSRFRYLGYQNFIISPIKQHEFKRICDAVGGVFLDLGSTSKQRINIFDINPLCSPDAKYLGDEGYINKAWLIDKIDALKIWITLLIPEITRAEKSRIETILMQLYSDFGFTVDNDSIYLDKEKEILKKPPILSDFYDRIVQDDYISEDIKIIFSQFVTGAAQSLNGYTNVDLDNKYIVFGLENIKGDLMAPTMFVILDFIWSKCRENRTKRKAVLLDEGWKLLIDEEAGEFVRDIFKLIRGYGGSGIFSTQQINDLYEAKNNYGNAIIANSHNKIILGMEFSELSNITGALGLSQEEQEVITEAEPGQALLCAGSSHIPLRIEVSPLEHELFTTQSDDLAEIARKKSEEA